MSTPTPANPSRPLSACTIATRNQVAAARVLVESFREHHPDGSFTVLLVGGASEGDCDGTRPAIAGAEVRLLDEIGLDEPDLVTLGVCYELDELVAVVKPWLLLSLLDGPADHVVYLDPDVWIARALAELPDLVREGSIVLTPYLTEPMPRDGKQPSEQELLLGGVFDTGFLAVAADDNSRRMLAWWCSRLRTEGHHDASRGFFGDRRWVDFVPGLFDHHIVRDPTWDVAYWNLATRPLTRGGDGGVLVSGRPLSFFHFSGYSPLTPHLLSRDQVDNPRIRLGDDAVLRDLCDDYAARLAAAGSDDVLPPAQPFSTFDGLDLDWVVRGLVRAEMAAQERGQGAGLDLAGGAATLTRWLMEGDQTRGPGATLGRYFGAVWARRPDLHPVYPEVRSGDPGGFLDWCELRGIDELGLARWPITALRERYPVGGQSADAQGTPGVREPRPLVVPGAEVVGFLSADLGIGQAARMLVAGLEAAGIDVSTTTYTNTSSRLGTPWTDRPGPENGRHDIAIVCINADMLPTFMGEDGGAELLADRYVVGFWFWELADFPDHFRPALEPLDELWVTSEFTAEVLRGVTDLPVHILPLPVHAPRDTGMRIPEVAVEGPFTFLFVFDYLSVIERKNPFGLVDAFKRAFPGEGRARLVIKTTNADKRAADQERLRYAVRDHPDIVLVERYLSRDELDGLMWAADCYVSLHRSEGFGFTMAEEMAIGKPVIATGYSGNVTFMTKQNSRLVDYTMVEVPPGCEPYPTTSWWAQPRAGQAARMMRRVAEDAELRERLSSRAAADIAKRHSVDALAGAAQRRLVEIRAEQAAVPRADYRLRDRMALAAHRIRRRPDDPFGPHRGTSEERA